MTTVMVTTCESPVGELRVAATRAGICSLEWTDSAVGRRRLEALGHLTEVDRLEGVVHLEAYFAGDVDALVDIDVDLSLAGTDFVREVLDVLRQLPVGVLTTYGELAMTLGRPGGAQAVGQAVGANPVPIIVPCHRVISADGSLGGFSGGLATKRALLALEGFADLPGGWARRADGDRSGQLSLEL